MESVAPIALFGYDRADHLEETIRHLRHNELADRSDVYVLSDGAKKAAAEPGVRAVRQLAKSIAGFASVTLIQRDSNWGLRQSLSQGVGQIAKQHGRVIVVEDDIITIPCFLRYMNEALEFYKDYQTVASISGYQAPAIAKACGRKPHETFFHYRTNCWGWATWWDRWSKTDWNATGWEKCFQSPTLRKLFCRGGSDFLLMLRESMEGKNQSWMARWYYTCFLHGMVTLWPGRSLVDNIGFDGSGTHSQGVTPAAYRRFRVALEPLAPAEFQFPLPVHVDAKAHKAMKRFWDPAWLPNSPIATLLRPIYRRLRKLRQRGAT